MTTTATQKPIVVVTEGGPHIWAIVNAIGDALQPVTVILETPESKATLLRRRARKQGWISVAGQIGTMVFTRAGKRLFADRMQRLMARNHLEAVPNAQQKIMPVPSANSAEFLETLDEIRPAVVLLAGCRMLSPATLAAIKCPVLNYHAGITPKYRGMNGGYWALATGDPDNFGATVHLVDTGVDTGAVLYQVRGRPDPHDNLTTYALRLAAISRPMCIKAIQDALDGTLEPIDTRLASRQWYHPPIWTYLWTGIRRGIW